MLAGINLSVSTIKPTDSKVDFCRGWKRRPYLWDELPKRPFLVICNDVPVQFNSKSDYYAILVGVT